MLAKKYVTSKGHMQYILNNFCSYFYILEDL